MFSKEKHPHIVQVLSAVKILIYLNFLISSGMFYHAHITPDGRVIAHSHIFAHNNNTQQSGNTPLPTHQHTNLEYKILNLASSLLAFIVILASISRIFGYTVQILEKLKTSFVSNIILSIPLRAPPVII